jgi:hypothetical protein
MPPPPPAFPTGENVRIEKMGVMRKKIADHMVMSIHTSPHVYSAYEVDFGRIDELRKKHKAAYEAAGTKLTFTGFIAKATSIRFGSFRFRTRRLTARTSSTNATSISVWRWRSRPASSCR